MHEKKDTRVIVQDITEVVKMGNMVKKDFMDMLANFARLSEIGSLPLSIHDYSDVDDLGSSIHVDVDYEIFERLGFAKYEMSLDENGVTIVITGKAKIGGHVFRIVTYTHESALTAEHTATWTAIFKKGEVAA